MIKVFIHRKERRGDKKKKAVLLLMCILLLLISACSYSDPVIGSLPAYKSESFYTSGGFQDFTDYAKYTYPSIRTEELKFSDYFRIVTADDVEEILLHIDNFEEWVAIIGGELGENYDFDKSIVSEGDFFYIKTKAGEPGGQAICRKFDNYTVYYFDVDALILYYFHNNI